MRALKTVDTQILGPAAKAVLQQSFLHRIQARSWRGQLTTLKGAAGAEGKTPLPQRSAAGSCCFHPLQDYLQAHSLPQPATLLDIGCGPGPSSREAADLWPGTQVTGVDLSPHYIALAEAQERCVDWPLLAGLAPFLQLPV